jgi:hypothetical protein
MTNKQLSQAYTDVYNSENSKFKHLWIEALEHQMMPRISFKTFNNEGISAASFCHQVAASQHWSQICFATFI